jgi:hypothetical protein
VQEKLGGYRSIDLTFDMEQYAETKRAEAPELCIVDRRNNFAEIELGFTEEVAQLECRRCLRCDLE